MVRLNSRFSCKETGVAGLADSGFLDIAPVLSGAVTSMVVGCGSFVSAGSPVSIAVTHCLMSFKVSPGCSLGIVSFPPSLFFMSCPAVPGLVLNMSGVFVEVEATGLPVSMICIFSGGCSRLLAVGFNGVGCIPGSGVSSIMRMPDASFFRFPSGVVVCFISAAGGTSTMTVSGSSGSFASCCLLL